MCRFTFYIGAPISLGSLITEPAHSLIKQSFNSKERSEPLNGDGFGIAWYANDDDEAAVFRSITPAWNLSLIHISEPTRLRRISYAVFCLKKKK